MASMVSLCIALDLRGLTVIAPVADVAVKSAQFGASQRRIISRSSNYGVNWQQTVTMVHGGDEKATIFPHTCRRC